MPRHIILNDLIVRPEPDHTTRIEANWTVQPDTPPETYSASLQLLNAQGEKVAQHDFGLNVRYYNIESVHVPTDRLPSGTYTLFLRLYAWRTQAAAVGTRQQSGQQGEFLPVAQIVVR